MTAIAENLIVMVLSVVFLLGGFYLLLFVLDVFLKLKSGSRENDGLTDLFISAQNPNAQAPGNAFEHEHDADFHNDTPTKPTVP